MMTLAPCRRDHSDGQEAAHLHQRQAQQLEAAQMDTFNRAPATCFQARGYSVN